jgi:hypothetical protein
VLERDGREASQDVVAAYIHTCMASTVVPKPRSAVAPVATDTAAGWKSTPPDEAKSEQGTGACGLPGAGTGGGRAPG